MMFFTENETVEIKVEHEETPQEICEKMYGMGSDYLLSEEECSYEYLAQKIVEMEDNKAGKTENKCNITKSYSDERAEVMHAKDLKSDAKDLSHLFTREGGYIDQIKKYLNIDFEKFDDSDIKSKREKVKIIYLLYTLKPQRPKEGGTSYNKTKKADDEDKVNNILKMIGWLSMENVDTSVFDTQTYNGEDIKAIREKLEKEIKQEMQNRLNKAFLLSFFLDFILKSQNIITDFYANIGRNDIALSCIEKVKQSIDFPKKFTEEYELSPIEMFYFRILQFEIAGNIKDILFINDIETKSNYSVPPDMIEEMKMLAVEKIPYDEIDSFIDNSIEEIAPYIFLKKDIDDNDLKKLRYHKPKIKEALDYFCRTNFTVDVHSVLNKLHIVSVYQAIILDEQGEIFKYKFSGYRKHVNTIRVQAALKNGLRTVDALKTYWTRKINDHWYANIGRYELWCKFRELQYFADNLFISDILTCVGPTVMEDLLEFYMHEVAPLIINTLNSIHLTSEAVEMLNQYLLLLKFEDEDEDEDEEDEDE